MIKIPISCKGQITVALDNVAGVGHSKPPDYDILFYVKGGGRIKWSFNCKEDRNWCLDRINTLLMPSDITPPSKKLQKAFDNDVKPRRTK